jgi:hypothetical protein
VNDGGVVDRSDQLHAAGTARTAQDVQVEGPAHQGRPCPVAGRGGAAAFGLGPAHGLVQNWRRVSLGATVGDDLYAWDRRRRPGQPLISGWVQRPIVRACSALSRALGATLVEILEEEIRICLALLGRDALRSTRRLSSLHETRPVTEPGALSSFPCSSRPRAAAAACACR